MFQICGCGAQPGYAHLELCPFPYYGNDPKMIDKWTAEYLANEKAAEHSVQADLPSATVCSCGASGYESHKRWCPTNTASR